MASIKKTRTRKGQDRWVVYWRANGRLAERWHRSRAAAERHRNEVELDAAGGREIDPLLGRQTLNAYFDAWLPARLVEGRPLRPSTSIGYERLWRRTVSKALGGRQLRNVRPDAVREWHGRLSAAKGHDQAAKAYRLLHAVLATAEADEVIRSNPCRIRGAGQEHAEERPMPETTLVLDLADAIGRRYMALVLAVAFSSTRTGEALGLRRMDVDLAQGELNVAVQAQELRGMGRAELEYTKTEAGRRTISIPRLVVDALAEHMAEFTGPDPESPVFTGPRGGPLRRATLSAAWRAAVKAVRAPEGMRLYDLRHHAATLTARKPDITLKELMARIGHSSLRAAIRYQHAARERDREVAGFLDDQIASAERSAAEGGGDLAPIIPLRARTSRA